MVQWLRHQDSNVRGVSLIPGRGTKTPHAMWHAPQKKIEKEVFFIKCYKFSFISYEIKYKCKNLKKKLVQFHDLF